jgi:hypothetical protein
MADVHITPEGGVYDYEPGYAASQVRRRFPRAWEMAMDPSMANVHHSRGRHEPGYTSQVRRWFPRAWEMAMDR